MSKQIVDILHGILPVFTEAEMKGVCFDVEIFDFIRDAYVGLAEAERQTMASIIPSWIEPRLRAALKENSKKKKPLPQIEVERKVFNPGSTQQKKSILFEDYFRMPVIKEGKAGASGDKEVIEALLRHKDVTDEGKAFLEALSKYTGLKKLISSYLDNANEMLEGCIYHPNYQINGTVTGRHSSGFHTLPKKCFTGETKISLLDGSEVEIKDLVGRDEFWLFSRDSNGYIVPGLGHSARITKYVTEMCIVLLDNNEVIKCTTDHPFMLRDGSYKEASDLTPEDSLMPLYRYKTNGFGAVNKQNPDKNIYYSVRQPKGKLKPLHRLVYESLSPIVSFIKDYLSTHDSLTKKQYNEYREVVKLETGRRNSPNWENLFKKTNTESVEELIDFCNSYNHKIKKVKIVTVEPTPMYDITVDDYHNFALTAGIFVHNSDIKRLFISRWKKEGGLFGCFDFSQLELRVVASLANETKWIEAFNNGVDIHAATAAAIYGIDLDKVSSDQRKAAKTINFGNIYGLSDKGLAEQLNIKLNAAKKIKQGLFEGCANLGNWFQECHKYVDAHNYIITVFGRKLPIDMKDFRGEDDKEANHRRAVNYSVQSPASDLVSDSIGRLYKVMKRKKMKTLIVGSVHDSILFDIYPGELHTIIKLVKSVCETESKNMYPWIKCPIVVDCSFGSSWGGCIDFDVEYTPEGILLKGEGLRKDFRTIMADCAGIYDWDLTTDKEELIEKQPKDKVIKDKYQWESTILLRGRL